MTDKNKKTLLIVIPIALVVIAAIVVGAILLLGGGDDAYRTIKVYRTEGSSEVKRAGGDAMKPYENMLLENNDAVKTLEDGYLYLKLDDDKFLAIYPRSGLGFKYKMQLFNSVGIVDSDYSQSDNEGHIWAKFYNDSPDGKTITIKQGEAMCQGIIQQFFKTDDDETDGVRNGGMGSTTK